jgi:hypothetical protein
MNKGKPWLLFRRISVVVACVVVALGAVVVICYNLWEKKRELSFVPDGLGISTIVYSQEESWGGGPGGNQTGIIVYELPDGVSKKIQNEGIEFLNTMPQNSGSTYDWHGRYEKWESTPILLDGSDGNTNSTKSYEIAKYLNRYGFGIPVDQQVEREINDAISKPGSFVAYGRIGLLIVIPVARRAVYAYNG